MSDERLAEIREWARFGFRAIWPESAVHDLLAEVERLRAPAQLGSAGRPYLERIVAQWDELQAGRVEGGIFLNRVQGKDVEEIRASLLAAFQQEDSRG